MFYEIVGVLLSRAGDAMAAGDWQDGTDDRRRRQLRQISMLLRRVGHIWPLLFAAVLQEDRVLQRTLDTAEKTLSRHGLARPADTPPLEHSDDPLERHYDLLTRLTQVVTVLHAHRELAWTQQALRSLRGGLAEAAAIEGDIIERALAL
jgi:hypothetical protein